MCMVVFHFFYIFLKTNFLSYILLFVCLFYELFFLLYLICLCACKCIQLSTYLPIYTSLSLSFWKMNGYIKTGKFEKRQEVGFNMSTIFGTTTFIEGLFLTADFIYLLILDSFKQLAPPFPNLLLFFPLFSFWVCQMKLRSPPPPPPPQPRVTKIPSFMPIIGQNKAVHAFPAAMKAVFQISFILI